jgi:hypothetical protein
MEKGEHKPVNSFEEIVDKLHNMRLKDRKLIKILTVSIVFIILAGVVGYLVFVKELRSIRTVQKDQYDEHLVTNQFLLSTIDWSTLRTKTILYMRDKIVAEWNRAHLDVDLEEAYKIAEINMKECENFPYMDPFLVLAMQQVESSFRCRIVSPMGAVGLNQIMPSTGRLLCASFGWTYSDSILYSGEASTHLAVKLLDVLYAQYNRWDYVLADYNGGPYQAYYYKTDKNKVVPETKSYVPNVLSKRKEYVEDFKTYRIDKNLTSQIIDNTKRK